MSRAAEYGDLLRAVRGRRSLEDVAAAVGVSCAALTAYESGERVPRDEVRQRLERYYGPPLQMQSRVPLGLDTVSAMVRSAEYAAHNLSETTQAAGVKAAEGLLRAARWLLEDRSLARGARILQAAMEKAGSETVPGIDPVQLAAYAAGELEPTEDAVDILAEALDAPELCEAWYPTFPQDTLLLEVVRAVALMTYLGRGNRAAFYHLAEMLDALATA